MLSRSSQFASITSRICVSPSCGFIEEVYAPAIIALEFSLAIYERAGRIALAKSVCGPRDVMCGPRVGPRDTVQRRMYRKSGSR